MEVAAEEEVLAKEVEAAAGGSSRSGNLISLVHVSFVLNALLALIRVFGDQSGSWNRTLWLLEIAMAYPTRAPEI